MQTFFKLRYLYTGFSSTRFEDANHYDNGFDDMDK